jgi:hypothetical protein
VNEAGDSTSEDTEDREERLQELAHWRDRNAHLEPQETPSMWRGARDKMTVALRELRDAMRTPLPNGNADALIPQIEAALAGEGVRRAVAAVPRGHPCGAADRRRLPAVVHSAGARESRPLVTLAAGTPAAGAAAAAAALL